jgi:hypothetical protein
MAQASSRLVVALRETAARLERRETAYCWSRFALCNCGHLAQTITRLAPTALEAAAGGRHGDWGDQARTLFRPAALVQPDYGDRPALDEGAWEPDSADRCNVADRAMAAIVEELQAWGLDPTDIDALERLNDTAVRRRLGNEALDFSHADRDNAVSYMRAWADLLEARLAPEDRALDGSAPALPLAAE